MNTQQKLKDAAGCGSRNSGAPGTLALGNRPGRPAIRARRRIAILGGVLPALVASLCLAILSGNSAQAKTYLNGAAPRPFYIIGHNPNNLVDAEVALKAGANALEPDITLYDCNGYSNVLIVYHDDPCPGGPTHDVLGLDTYLEGVHDLAIKYPQLALIVLDVKTSAAGASQGPRILNSVRTHLNYGEVNLNVLINVGSRSDGALFDNILGSLGPREGVIIDGEDNAADIVNFFFDKGYTGNIGYGDGTAAGGPNLPRALDKGAFLRASTGYPKMVSYVYTLQHSSTENSFIDGGVDGIIPDGFPPPFQILPFFIMDLVDVVNTHSEIRVAERTDNPFQPLNEAYGLEIRTLNETGAGTDADLTFTLTGCLGSATITVNSGYINPTYNSHRMEPDQTDWVTMPSRNLGTLTSITVHNGGGINFPNWHLQDITISSARWMGPNFGHAREYTAIYYDELQADDTVVLNLAPNFPEPLPTIQCPATLTVANDPNECGAVVHFAPVVNGPCDDAVCSPVSGSLFPIGQTVVTCYAKSASGPESDPCTFTVSVQDTELPLISCPAPMSVNATGPNGAAVTFAATATDNCTAVVSYSKDPGTVFPIGTTTVTCTATDPSQNQSACNFTVHIKGAAEQIADLVGAVSNLNLPNGGIKNALLAKLDAALGALQKNHQSPACGSLEAFINQVNALRNKSISSSDADTLIAAANLIRAVLACP